MRKYFIVVLAFFTFCSNDAALTTDLGIEKDIIQTEEKIEELKSKDSLNLEERQELENLEEKIEELEENFEESEEYYEIIDEENLSDDERIVISFNLDSK